MSPFEEQVLVGAAVKLCAGVRLWSPLEFKLLRIAGFSTNCVENDQNRAAAWLLQRVDVKDGPC